MGIHPGQTVGRKPTIGPRVELRVPPGDLARIDWIVSEARRRYSRVPREFRSRPAVIRAALRAGLDPLVQRVVARPEPED